MGGAEGTDVRRLDRGEVQRPVVLRTLRFHHAAGQEIQTVLTGPLRRAQTGPAVPQPVPQAGGVRLHPVGEVLESLAPAEACGRLTAHEVQQPPHPLVAEVLGVRCVGVQRSLDPLVVHRRAHADARVQPSSGQEVDRRQVLGQSQRVLPAERGDGDAERDAVGALRSGGQYGDGTRPVRARTRPGRRGVPG